jgi:predicted transcriptional regulator
VNLIHEKEKEMTDVYELRRKIETTGMSITYIARKSGILRGTLYKRFQTGDFKLSEICALSSVLSLSNEEREKIFFDKRCE